VSDIDIDPSLLKGDFDPEKHEELVEKLAANFGDDELDENGEIMKVTFLASAAGVGGYKMKKLQIVAFVAILSLFRRAIKASEPKLKSYNL
jgi:hypothetical protein